MLLLVLGGDTSLPPVSPLPMCPSRSPITQLPIAVIGFSHSKLPLHTWDDIFTVHYSTVQYSIGNAVLVQYSHVALFMPGILDSLPGSSEGPKAPIALQWSDI